MVFQGCRKWFVIRQQKQKTVISGYGHGGNSEYGRNGLRHLQRFALRPRHAYIIFDHCMILARSNDRLIIECQVAVKMSFRSTCMSKYFSFPEKGERKCSSSFRTVSCNSDYLKPRQLAIISNSYPKPCDLIPDQLTSRSVFSGEITSQDFVSRCCPHNTLTNFNPTMYGRRQAQLAFSEIWSPSQYHCAQLDYKQTCCERGHQRGIGGVSAAKMLHRGELRVVATWQPCGSGSSKRLHGLRG